MASYATVEEVEAVIGADDITEAEVEQASLDIDLYILGARQTRDETTGLKLTPADLTEPQQSALIRATAWQCRYRRKLGENFWSTPQRNEVSIDGVSYKGQLPYADHNSQLLLADVGLVARLGRVRPRGDWTPEYDRGWHRR